MDPVLQRLGDVTIQRLDKSKENKIETQNVATLENETNKVEDINVAANKRIMPNSPGPSYKRTRIDIRRNTDDVSDHSFSDEDTDYDLESDIESDIDIHALKRNLEENVNSDLEDNYLQSFPDEQVTSDNAESTSNIKSESEEYDIDIKEKLKEMGEISFETVKKGEKPKKSEKAADNEVVVTATKKSNRLFCKFNCSIYST